MAHNFYAKSPVLGLAILALIIFLCLFVIVVVRVLRSKQGAFKTIAKMPLDTEADQ